MTTVEVQHVLRAQHLKSPWVLDTETVDDRTYVRLFKWSRDFVRFISGRSLDFGDKTTFGNLKFFDTLLRLRNNACDSALDDVLDEARRDGDEINGNNANVKKRRKVNRKARPSDAAVLPAAVSMSLPTLDISHPPTVYILTSAVRSRELVIELSPEILDYIRHGCLKSEGRPDAEPSLAADGEDRAESAGELDG